MDLAVYCVTAGGSFYVIMEGAVDVYHKPMVDKALVLGESTDE